MVFRHEAHGSSITAKLGHLGVAQIGAEGVICDDQRCWRLALSKTIIHQYEPSPPIINHR